MNALMANRVVAVPVAAPPGHWIGAGGSMILESDKQTGAARKHYIGMVTTLDVMAAITGDQLAVEASDLERRMQVPVSSIIGHCLESLSLWTLNCNTSILDCMEVFSKGIHRALVPVDSQIDDTVGGVELMESASCYRMVTQMDLLKFLKAHENELSAVLARPIKELGAVTDTVFGVTNKSVVLDVIRSMNSTSLNAVPVCESTHDDTDEDHRQIINGNGRKLVGTFSATDIRVCPGSQLRSSLQMNVLDFVNNMSAHHASKKELITCRRESLLGEVVEKVINNHVHRVWVVDESGLLSGLVSLTDIIRATRVWMLSESSSS